MREVRERDICSGLGALSACFSARYARQKHPSPFGRDITCISRSSRVRAFA